MQLSAFMLSFAIPEIIKDEDWALILFQAGT